jgi:hypothetical protein
MNKYKKWYSQIIANGKSNRLVGYELHHILPKSLGGADDTSNLIYITTREHFICHWLLTKIYPTGEEHWKMLNALRMMRAENPNQTRYNTKITSRVYAKLKEEYSALQSNRYKGSGNGMYGKNQSIEAKQKIGKANSGDRNGAKQTLARKKITESKLGKTRDLFNSEWKENLSQNHKSKKSGFNGALSDATKQKMREKATGRTQTEETIKKKADAVRGLKREKLLCPHCQQSVAVNGYARWHGDNCKQAK